MVQIPDSIRPVAKVLQKNHFWILSAIAPLILLPLLFIAQAGISATIETRRGKVKSALDSLKTIVAKSPHPNEKWADQIGARTGEIDKETLEVWERLWKAQQPIREWPASLGKDFVTAASELKPEKSLRRSLLERYQDGVRTVVRQIPSRMGADELMTEGAGTAGANAAGSMPRGPGQPAIPGPPGQGEQKQQSLLQWSSSDQQELFNSFDWTEPPSTTQVLLAQEELWMYGVLCDVIKRINSSAVGAAPNAVVTPANIPIPLVQQLKVGYPAAEDDPGGKSGNRITRIQQKSAGIGMEEMMPPPDMMLGAEGQAVGRPPHPRFSAAGSFPTGAASGPSPGMMPGAPFPGVEAGGAEVSPDDALKNWVYVDLDGNPLTATDLASSSLSQVLRLMPFVLKLTIDQRSLDALLVELASSPVPIDTRQVRIGVDAASGGTVGGGPLRPADPQPGTVVGDRSRLHDVNVELRGTLAIVRPPNRLLLQSEDGQGAPGEGR